MDGIPTPLFNVFFVIDLFLYQEARVEAWILSVHEVNTRMCKVVVELHVGGKHRVGLLLKLQQVG